MTIKAILASTVIGAVCLSGAIMLWMRYFMPLPTDPTLRLEYFKYVLEVFKTIGIGFLITLLGILIPNILPEAKYQFELVKEGREVFSKAKTGIDYLPYSLAELNFADAIKHIETIHQLKHLADAYINENRRVGRWHIKPYETIVAYRNAVTSRVNEWDALTRNQRLGILEKVLVSLNSYQNVATTKKNIG